MVWPKTNPRNFPNLYNIEYFEKCLRSPFFSKLAKFEKFSEIVEILGNPQDALISMQNMAQKFDVIKIEHFSNIWWMTLFLAELVQLITSKKPKILS